MLVSLSLSYIFKYIHTFFTILHKEFIIFLSTWFFHHHFTTQFSQTGKSHADKNSSPDALFFFFLHLRPKKGNRFFYATTNTVEAANIRSTGQKQPPRDSGWAEQL